MPPIVTPFTHDDYEILNRDVPYQGKYRIARYELRIRLFNGEMSTSMMREAMERSSSVAILPYDPISDRVVLIEQFRIGALANPQSPWILEAVAGVIDLDESPKEVAKREANEEAGCDILDLYPICEYFVSPGGCNEYLYLFCGRIGGHSMDGVYGLAHEHEDIRAFSISSDEAYQLVQQGRIKTSPAIISLQWLQLNREWLKQLWQK